MRLQFRHQIDRDDFASFTSMVRETEYLGRSPNDSVRLPRENPADLLLDTIGTRLCSGWERIREIR